MKVVHISTSDIGHGAGIAAYRTSNGLVKIGVDSKMIVSEKLSDDERVFASKKAPVSFFEKAFRKTDHFIEHVLNLVGPQNVYSVASRGLAKNDIIKEADVIHIHNIHWSIRNLSLLLLLLGRKKPVTWTFHDMWPITGHCFYAGECRRWKTGCGKCPDINMFVRVLYDSSAFQWKLKNFIYKKTNFSVISPSKWLADVTKSSELFDKSEVVNIPNCVDTDTFKPLDRALAHGKLGIDTDKKVVLCLEPGNDRKGYKYFEKAMLKLDDKNDIFVLIAGHKGDLSALEEKYEVKDVGLVKEAEKMCAIYSSADLYVLPSIEDNLPNVILESMASGTPVAAFEAGGMPDMVDHLENGYLAKTKDTESLAKGIHEILHDDEKLKKMSENALRTINKKFRSDIVSKRLVEHYHSIINKFNESNSV